MTATDAGPQTSFRHEGALVSNRKLSSTGSQWFCVGPAASFPNISDSTEKWFKLVWPQPLKDGTKAAGCKVFHAEMSANAREIPIDSAVSEDAWLMREQVMVFQYKGRFHAVDHACPRRTYSLTWGVPFDIEDAGHVLGSGLRCRGHSYEFELSTGIGHRGGCKLGIWDVELRDSVSHSGEKTVWVRRNNAAKSSATN